MNQYDPYGCNPYQYQAPPCGAASCYAYPPVLPLPVQTEPMAIPLHDYQVFAKNFLLTHPFCGLFMKMGLGKTSVVLESIWEMNPHHHVLVVAPKTIARSTWIGEIRKWKLPLRTCSLIVDEKGRQLTKKKREALYDSIPSAEPTLYFINREMVTNLINYFGSKWCFPMVIIDESQSFKSYDSVRFKAMKKIRPMLDRLVLLTGSPQPKGLMDLWAQIWLLDMGERLGKTITRYREEYFNPGLIVNNYPVTWWPRQGAEDVIYDKIADLVISMKNIKLPPVTFNDVYAYMEDDERALYKEMMTTNVLELDKDTTVTAANAAVLSAKLSQMASGAIYRETGSHEFTIIHRHKLELTEYIINNTPSPVIVAYHFISDKVMLMQHFKEVGIEAEVFDGTPEMIDRWNERQIPVMLLQPASGGFGINLQYGGETLIWYSLPWSLEQYEQTNARIWRQGQTNSVVIHRLMTKSTIDTKILHAIEEKDLSQKRLLAAVEAAVRMDDDDGDDDSSNTN